MRRGLTYLAWLSGALLLLTLAVAGWLLGTRSGSEWLLARLNSQGPVRISADVEGSLWSGLDLAGVQFDWPGGRATTDRLQLRWQPLGLLSRELNIESLSIGVTRISWSAPAVPSATMTAPTAVTPISAFWPRLPGWLLAAKLDLQQLKATEISLGSSDGEPLVLGELRAQLAFVGGALTAERLHLRLPCGSWDGSVKLDLRERRVAADLVWRGSPFVADWDGVHTVVELDNSGVGSLTAESLAGSAERISLNAAVALTGAEVTLSQLAVARSQAPDRVAGTLQVHWQDAFRLTGDLRLTHLDLAAEAGWPTDLSGEVQAEMTSVGYAGRIDLESFRPGLEQGRLAGVVTGDWRGLQLQEIAANWLSGNLTGELQMDWRQGYRLDGRLQGRDLDPATLVPDISGSLALAVSGGLQVSPAGELSANWAADIDRSELQQRPLRGRFVGRWQQDDLVIDELGLQGDGLQVKGKGELSRRIDWQLQVADLARLGKNWQGALVGSGWLARPDSQWIGAASGELHELQISEVRAEQGSFQLDYPGPDAESRLELDLQQLSLPQGTLDQVTLNGNGRLAEHQLEVSLSWPSGALAGSLSGGWQDARWTGLVSDLHGHEDQIGAWRQVAQASLQLSRQRIAVDQLQLVDEQGGVVFLDSSMQPQPLAGSVRARWQELSLGFLNPFLAGPDLDGAADGELQLDMRAGGSLELTMQLAAAPVLQWQGRKLAFAASSINARWGSDGLEADAQLALAGGGQASFSMTSTEPGRLRQPERAELSVSWKDLELSQLSPWLPAELALSGQWHGNFAGNWRKGAAPGLSGRTWIDRGGLLWQGADGVVELPLAQAELNGDWRDGWSEGTLNLQLGEQGRIKGRFRLPTGQDNPSAPLTAEADFSIEELGLLMLLMPGISQETHGLLTGDLRLAGTWAKPELFGKVSLRGASAEVPNLGLQLHDAEFDLSFSQTRLKLERLQLRSGEGRLTGDGEVWLTGWRPQRWALNLKGDNLRLVHLPEITLEAAPDLQLSGTPELLTVRGEVTVPTLLISEVPRTRMVEPSEDVVLTDATAEAPSKVFKQLDVKLQVKLGEHVAVKAKGLDARLEGDLVVSSNQSGAFVGQGEIRVAQGHYAAYGLKLPISHGRAAFGGGALESPNLDVLAERTIGEVKAGVQVTGTPRKPVVKLVSEPSLPDTEILSYIVLGRPLNATGGDQSNLMLAAGALLSQGESAALQEKLKRSFGLDTIEVQSGGEQGVEGSMVAVGKYLTPELYLSFGQSLFTRESVAKLRYEISQRWELESQFGTVSGADLSYRIEFR